MGSPSDDIVDRDTADTHVRDTRAHERMRMHTLAERIRAGDATAFNALYVAMFPRALRVARRYAPASVPPEDIVQEVFLRVWDGRNTLEPSQYIESYILTSIQHRAFDLMRHEQHVRRSETGDYSSTREPPPAMGTPAESLEDSIDRATLAAQLQDAIDALPERQRRIVTFRWRRQMSYDAIAADLGVTVKVVRLDLERAYQTLRPLLAHLTD